METENFQQIDIAKEKTFTPSIKESIQTIIDKEGFVTHKVYKRELSTNGGNYMGSLYEVDVKGKTLEEEKEINIIVKRSINQTCDESETFISIPGAYAKEQLFYEELAKVFTALEEDAKLPEKERLRIVKGYPMSSLEAIILENLHKQGYRTLNRMETFSLKFAELSIKQLATLHGLSLVLKLKNPEYFEKNIRTLSKPLTFNESWRVAVMNLLNITKSYLDEEWLKKVESNFSICPDVYMSYFDSNSSTVNCLCHGDYNNNNILAKTVNGEIVDVIPIDYQMMYFGNPVNDIFYFVYMGSDRDFRKKHLMDLKNLYYDNLETLFQYFNLNIENIYPRETFERDFKERRQMGLLIALFLFPLMFVIEEEIPSVVESDWTKVSFKLDPRYGKRIVEVLEEYEELGFFV